MGTIGGGTGGTTLGDTDGVTATDALGVGVGTTVDVGVGVDAGVGSAVDEGVTAGVGASAAWAGAIAVAMQQMEISAGIPMRTIGLTRNIHPSSLMATRFGQSRLARSLANHTYQPPALRAFP